MWFMVSIHLSTDSCCMVVNRCQCFLVSVAVHCHRCMLILAVDSKVVEFVVGSWRQ